MKLAEKQAEFLRVLAETGSAVQARRAVGVGSRAVRKWQEDESFLDAYNEAIEIAQDAIRAKVREMALGGSEPMLALSMRVIEPALRPAGNQVAVGVQVNGAGGGDDFSRRLARVAKMSDEELLAEIRRIQDDIEMRLGPGQLAADIVDADVVEASEASPPPVEEVRVIERASAAPAGSGDAAEPSVEGLI